MKIMKKAQEEMIGFVLIIIVVAVIILILLSFSLTRSNKETIESYEVGSFMDSALKYTSECSDNFDFLDVRELIIQCYEREDCIDGRDSCELLEITLSEIISNSWDIREDRPIKGYDLKIISGDDNVIPPIVEGEVTGSSKGSSRDFSRRGDLIEILFTVYS